MCKGGGVQRWMIVQKLMCAKVDGCAKVHVYKGGGVQRWMIVQKLMRANVPNLSTDRA